MFTIHLSIQHYFTEPVKTYIFVSFKHFGHVILKLVSSIMLHGSLFWKPHIYHVRNKISKAVGILNKLRYVNIVTMVNIYSPFVYPYFMYCVHVWENPTF